MLNPNPVPIEKIRLSILQEKEIQLAVKRLDKVHDKIPGNKFYKLKCNLLQAKKEHKDTLLTFGGAYSNHIQATAAAAKEMGFKSIGVIRGEELPVSNPTLTAAGKDGMLFYFISREEYRNKENPDFVADLHKKFGDFFLIPEGGTNELAIKGCSYILTEKDGLFDHIACSIGTGGTFAGLLAAAGNHQKIWGFSSLKGDFIHDHIQQLIARHAIEHHCSYQIKTAYHFGGYAKHQPELIRFIKTFYSQTGIPLDPIYTGKLMFGLLEEIKAGTFRAGSKILAIHTGGLQGIRGFNERFNESLPEK